MADTASMFGFSVPDLAGNAADRWNAQIQEGYAQQNAQDANNFADMMSSTAYQRTTADMKAAGINPLLAVTNGGASTPSAAMAAAPNMTSGQGQSNPGFSMSDINQASLAKSQSSLLKAQALKAVADTQQSNTASDLNRSVTLLRQLESDSQNISNLRQADEFNAAQSIPHYFQGQQIMQGLGGGSGSFMNSLGAASAALLAPALP